MKTWVILLSLLLAGAAEAGTNFTPISQTLKIITIRTQEQKARAQDVIDRAMRSTQKYLTKEDLMDMLEQARGVLRREKDRTKATFGSMIFTSCTIVN